MGLADWGRGCSPLPLHNMGCQTFWKCMKRLVWYVKLRFFGQKNKIWLQARSKAESECHIKQERFCARALKISVTKILLIFCSSSLELDVKKNWAKPLRHRHDFEAFGTKSWLLDAICMLFYGQQQFFLIWICDRVGRMDHEYLVCSCRIDLNSIFRKLHDSWKN